MTIPATRRAELRRLSKTMDIEPELDRPVDCPFLRDDVCESPWWYVTDVTGEKLIACANEEHAEFVAAAITAVPSLLDEIERFETLAAERYEEAEETHAVAGETTQSARPTIAGLRLQLSIATELNVNDRKQIERLETALSVANQVAGEAALVLEQQDRDLEKLRARVAEFEAQWSDLKPLC